MWITFALVLFYLFFNTFLSRFKDVHKPDQLIAMSAEHSHSEDYRNFILKKKIPNLLKALALSILIFAIGGGT